MFCFLNEKNHRASDYATGQFRFLLPLIFFHGRESYHRASVLLLYAFYKGVAFACLSLWFSIFSLFSGQTLFESWHFGMFHVFFLPFFLLFASNTMFFVVGFGLEELCCFGVFSSFKKQFSSLPIIIFSVTDFEVCSKAAGLAHPQLHRRDLFSLPLFLSWLMRGLVDSAIVFFVCAAAFGDDSPSSMGYGLFSLGICCLTATVLLVNMRLVLYVTHFTWVLAASFLLTLFVYFGFLLLVSVTSNSGKDQSMYFVSINVMGLPTFWLAVLLCIVIGLVFEWAWLALRNQPDTVLINRISKSLV